MKKIISLIAIVLVILSIPACGSDNSDNTDNTVMNSSTEDQIQTSKEYDTGITLSDNLMDFTVKIGGAVYKIPMELSAFQKNGWIFQYNFDEEKEIYSDHFESAIIGNGNNKLSIELFNKSLDVQKAVDCPVGRITYDFSGDVNIYLAGDTLLNTISQNEMIDKFGRPTSSEEYGDYIDLVYEKPNAQSIFERYTFQFETKSGKISQMSIVNFVETTTQNAGTTDDADISYLDKYVAPTELGTDMLSFNVSVFGDLYSLPVPVSQLLDNGWSVASNDIVGAGTYTDDIVFMKDGKKYFLGVYNFSKQRAEVKDCTVYKIKADPFDNVGIDLKLPGNITVGSSEVDVERMCSGFRKSDNTETVEYVKTTYDYMISFTISKETNTVDWITIYNKKCNYR